MSQHRDLTKHPVPKWMYEYIGGNAPEIQKAIESGNPIKPADAKEVLNLLERVLQNEKDGKAVIDSTVKKHYKALGKFLNDSDKVK